MRSRLLRPSGRLTVLLAAMLIALATAACPAQGGTPLFNDSHLHLTNYIQQGPTLHQLYQLVGGKAGRMAVFGIPLQQHWSYGVSGDKAPRYYLDTDEKLYYYSFVDANIAMEYKALPTEEQAHFDPMITGFNPTDMYAVDHIRRVLTLFPGVFTGIGEFTIHKEFVAPKVLGDTASLTDRALDRILDFAAEAGLVVILHNDLDVPFAKPGAPPAYADQLEALFLRHPNTTIIWAHAGLGRIVKPSMGQAEFIEKLLGNPALKNLYCDFSWDEAAKYAVSPTGVPEVAIRLVNKFPDRFLFGTDEVAPASQDAYLKVYNLYKPVLDAVSPAVREQMLKTNYQKVFDQGRQRVRAWEAKNVPAQQTPQ